MSNLTTRNFTEGREQWGPAFMLSLLLTLAPAAARAAEVFATGLQFPFGSTVGPGGDLYVADAGAGAIVRIDSRSGERSIYADGLPISPLLEPFGLGGVMDVTFVEGIAYALVTLVSPEVGGTDLAGIYRLEESGEWSVVADLGTFSAANLPAVPYDLPPGLQFAIQSFRGGFLVTDGNHNRVLHVTRQGVITEILTLDNVVPTGLEVRGDSVYLALAGPVPHAPEDGKVLRLDPRTWQATELASGAPLLVDVEFGRGTQLLALSQGGAGGGAGAPALPAAGALVALDGNGGFTSIEEEINLPTSMVIIRNAAYIVSLDGNVYRVPNVGGPPFGD